MIVFVLVASYLVGSIPSGVIIAKIVNPDVDLRDVGSGNIGATNVKRALGTKWAAVTLFFDALKGFIPVYLTTRYGLDEMTVCAAGFAAFSGHLFPVWLGFSGGKGVATTLGILLAFDLQIAFIAMFIWGTTSYISKTSAVGALAAALALPIAGIGLRPTPAVITFTALIGLMVIISHKDNIQRIKEGGDLPLKDGEKL